MKNKYKYLLFDADNTILDFKASEEQTLRVLFTEFGIDDYELGRYHFHEVSKRIWEDLESGRISMDYLKVERFRILLELLNHNCNPEHMANYFLEQLSKQEHMIPGAYEVLSELSEYYNLYVASNGFYDIQVNRFKTTGLHPLFKDYFISEEIGYSKPDVRYFEEIVNRIKPSKTTELLMIGDSMTSDIKGAVNSGIDAVYFNPHGQKSDMAKYNIDKLTDLLELLEVK